MMTWMMGEMMGDGDVSSYESIPIEIGKLLDGINNYLRRSDNT